MLTQFSRNLPALSQEQQDLLHRSHVLVLGCGGLGGYVIENLVRLGVGTLTAVDGDRFEESNLNRQTLSTQAALGRSKALEARSRALSIDPNIDFRAVDAFFSAENAAELLSGKDLVIDALDSIPDRLLLEQLCAGHGLSLVHGAVHGWMAQAAVLLPGSGLLERIYSGAAAPADKSCLAFAPALCAAVQCAAAVRLLCGEPSGLENRLLLADLKTMDFELLNF